MGEKPLVSIITPCFNGEKYLGNFLDSLLNQDYENCEIFFIDDGSSDSTKEIAEKYKELFENKGYDFLYIFQENAGQAAAINNGLKRISGKYLSWVDSDDILHKNYISSKVEFLEKNSKLDMVISPVNVVNEDDLEQIVEVFERKIGKKDDFFKDLMRFENSYYPPGGYMVKTDAFFKMNPSKQIIDSREGQNIQMIIPMAYLGTYGYLSEAVYDYVVHNNSHSHSKRDYETAVARVKSTSGLMKSVILNMPVEEIDKNCAASYVEKMLDRRLFYVSNSYHKHNEMKYYFMNMRRNKVVSFHDGAVYLKSLLVR